MKKKEWQEIKIKSIPELKKIIEELKKEIARLRIDKEAGKLKNVHLLTFKRHDLARLKTALREKELNENP